MKRLLGLGVALLAFPAAALAAGLNITWTDCYPTGTNDRNFNCTAASNNDLQFQYKVGVDIPHFTGMSSIVDAVDQTAGSNPLPPFWHYEACNGTGTAFSSDFSVSPAGCQSGAFSDTWGGQTPTVQRIAAYGPDNPQPGRGRFVLSAVISGESPLTANTNYWCWRLRFNTNNRATCPGCTHWVALYWRSANFARSDDPEEIVVTGPDNSKKVHGDVATINAAMDGDPTRASTWGQLKTLYR